MWATIEDFLNTAHYHVIERHVNHWCRALSRRWHGTMACLQRWRERQATQDTEEPIMEPSPQSMTLMQQMLASELDSLRTQIREELREEVREEERESALEQARAEFEEDRLKMQDQLAAEKEDVWAEVQDRVDAGVEKERARLRDEWLDDIRELKGQVASLSAERDAAEGALVHLAEELLPRDKFIYLRNAGIKRLDLTLLAPILAKRSLRIRTQMTPSQRTVEVMIAPGQPRARTMFMLESTIGADEDAGALALPEGSEARTA